MNGEVKRLYKSRTDRMIDGVCGGIAKYLSVDPTLVRVALVLLTLLGGSGILLYIVAMILLPKEPYVFNMGSGEASQPSSSASQTSTPSKKNNLFWGILLIVVGAVLFLDNIGLDFWRHWWWFFDGEVFLSILLILAGVAFLWGGRNSFHTQPMSEPAVEGEVNPPPLSSPRRLHRSFTDSKLFGVCGGLGEYFGIDSTIVRILFLVGVFASGGIVAIGYIIMAIVVPKANPTPHAI